MIWINKMILTRKFASLGSKAHDSQPLFTSSLNEFDPKGPFLVLKTHLKMVGILVGFGLTGLKRVQGLSHPKAAKPGLVGLSDRNETPKPGPQAWSPKPRRGLALTRRACPTRIPRTRARVPKCPLVVHAPKLRFKI